jgi:outer membrane protein OmpA-like peptidoglycan-associated protein
MKRTNGTLINETASVRRQSVNTTKHTAVNRRRTLIATAVVFVLVVPCTFVLIRPEGADGTAQNVAADQVRSKADAAHVAAARSEQKELQRQRDLQNAKPTDHGLVLTLGDVLFTSGRADLKAGTMGNLNKLAKFLEKYPDRTVAIHGYTDSLGSAEYNQGLSERRANSVKVYLADQGIDSSRLTALGMGQSAPVAGNDSGAGRQQNRRVEVIISNPPVALAQRDRTAKMIVLFTLLGSISGSTGRPLL